MSFPTLSRRDVVRLLTNEQGAPIVETPMLAALLDRIDDPETIEFLLKVIRQTGKTTALAVVAMTDLLSLLNSYTVLVSASEAQQKAIFGRKIRKPLERLAKQLGVEDEFRFTQNTVEVPALNSGIEVLASNEGTGPGRAATKLIIDEARDVADGVFTALAPSVIGTSRPDHRCVERGSAGRVLQRLASASGSADMDL